MARNRPMTLSNKLCKVHVNLDDDELCNIDFMGAKANGILIEFKQAVTMIDSMEQFMLDMLGLRKGQLVFDDFARHEYYAMDKIAKENGVLLPDRLVDFLHMPFFSSHLRSDEFFMAPFMRNKLFCLLFIQYWFSKPFELANYWLQLERYFVQQNKDIHMQFQKDLCYFISIKFCPNLQGTLHELYLRDFSKIVFDFQNFFDKYSELCDIDDCYVKVKGVKENKDDEFEDFCAGLDTAREAFNIDDSVQNSERIDPDVEDLTKVFDRDFLLIEDNLQEDRVVFRNRDRSCAYYKEDNKKGDVEANSNYDDDIDDFFDINNEDDIDECLNYYERRDNGYDDPDYGLYDDVDIDDDDDDDNNNNNVKDEDIVPENPVINPVAEKDKTDVTSMNSVAQMRDDNAQDDELDAKGIVVRTSDKVSNAINRARCLMRLKMTAFSVVDTFSVTDNTLFANDYYHSSDRIGGIVIDNNNNNNYNNNYDDDDDDDDDDVHVDVESIDDGASDNTSNKGSEKSDDRRSLNSLSSVTRLFANSRFYYRQTTEDFMKKYKVPHVHFFHFVKTSLLKMMRPRYDTNFSWKDRNITKRLHVIVLLMPYVYTHNMANLIYYELIKFERFSEIYEGLKANSLFGIFVYLQFCTEAQLSFILETLEKHRDKVLATHENLLDTDVDIDNV